MPSGRLVACDPYDVRDNPDTLEPYTVDLPPGRYQVTLNVARWEDQARVAAARLLIRAEPVASWELALRPGQDPRALRDGEAFGFGVDVGTACLVDAAAIGELAQLAADAGQAGVSGLGEVRITEVSASELADLAETGLVGFGSGADMVF
jgi:hypothetical protein